MRSGNRLGVIAAVLAAGLVLAVPASARQPATLGSAALIRLGDDIGRILGTGAWGIRTDVTSGGSPASQNAALRRNAPKVARLVRRYERAVSAGPCRTWLRRLASAYARGAHVTTANASAFNAATFRATDGTVRACG